jgi:hypothetical protein
MSPRGTVAMLATLSYVALILVPQLKYPASPPSVSEPDTIGARTALYFSICSTRRVRAAVSDL